MFGYRKVAEDGARQRFVAPAAGGATIGRRIDLRIVAGFPRGTSGAGTIHHIAFRAADDGAQDALRRALAGQGIATTEQLDRNYFRSIYFREPGHVLFEIATDDPGFAADEPLAALGTELKLPVWLEPHRHEIERVLPRLDQAVPA